MKLWNCIFVLIFVLVNDKFCKDGGFKKLDEKEYKSIINSLFFLK